MTGSPVPATTASILAPPPLPHEHGAWAMLAIPLLLGMAAAWPPAAAAWVIVPALGLLFLSRYAALSATKRLLGGKTSPAGFIGRRVLWSVGDFIAAVLLLVAAWRLAAPEARGGLFVAAAVTLVLGAAHTLLALLGLDRTIPGEMLGMAGLASGAPLVVAAAGRPLDRQAIGAGLVSLLYFATSLAYVKAVRGLWKGDRIPVRRCVAAHAAVAGALGTITAGTFITPMFAAAFVPVYARTAWGLFRPPAGLRVLGWREMIVAALFTLIGIAALALAP
jgi:YwiC-like protein